AGNGGASAGGASAAMGAAVIGDSAATGVGSVLTRDGAGCCTMGGAGMWRCGVGTTTGAATIGAATGGSGAVATGVGLAGRGGGRITCACGIDVGLPPEVGPCAGGNAGANRLEAAAFSAARMR